MLNTEKHYVRIKKTIYLWLLNHAKCKCFQKSDYEQKLIKHK